MMRFIVSIAALSFVSCSQPKEIPLKEYLSNSVVITDSVFTGGIEGPAVNSKGDLFVVNFEEEGTVGVLQHGEKEFKTFIKLPNGSIGNGIRFDSKDNMFIADYINHNILFIERGTKNVTVYAHNDSVNQPNDITLLNDESGFASDPNWAQGKGNLLRFKNGDLKIIETDLGTTNGIEVSPDGKFLYVNESVQTRIWRYDISENGSLNNKTLFIDFEGYGMDGMRCDKKGNIFLARYGKGVVTVISREGEVLNEIKLNGEKPTNVTFDPTNEKVLYVTLQDKKWVEKITLP